MIHVARELADLLGMVPVTDAAADEDADEVDLKETVGYSPKYVNGVIRCPTQWPFSFRTRRPNPHHAEREGDTRSST